MSADVFSKVKEILNNIQNEKVGNLNDLESFRIKYLGSKNEIKSLFGEIKNVENDRKKEFGQLLNDVKQSAEEKYELLKASLGSAGTSGWRSAPACARCPNACR